MGQLRSLPRASCSRWAEAQAAQHFLLFFFGRNYGLRVDSVRREGGFYKMYDVPRTQLTILYSRDFVRQTPSPLRPPIASICILGREPVTLAAAADVLNSFASPIPTNEQANQATSEA